MKRRSNGQIERATSVSIGEYHKALRKRLAAKSICVEGGCILWTGAKVGRGYGQIRIRNPANKSLLTHRAAWMLKHGRLPESGMDVCHKCDNPSCINPDHLFLGSRLENMRDMVAKGRAAVTRGELSGMARLSESDISRIHELSRRRIKQSVIAAEFDVHPAHISRIISGKRWPHIRAAR